MAKWSVEEEAWNGIAANLGGRRSDPINRCENIIWKPEAEEAGCSKAKKLSESNGEGGAAYPAWRRNSESQKTKAGANKYRRKWLMA